MNVEFKTRAGDKWTSLRHFDSGPWSGGGNPHWTSINITLRNVKNNDGIGERKKTDESWQHYPAQWSNARGLWDFHCPAVQFIEGMHGRLVQDNAADIESFKFLVVKNPLVAPTEYTTLETYVAAVIKLPDPEPEPEAEVIGEAEGVQERMSALEQQVLQLQKEVQHLKEKVMGEASQSQK